MGTMLRTYLPLQPMPPPVGSHGTPPKLSFGAAETILMSPLVGDTSIKRIGDQVLVRLSSAKSVGTDQAAATLFQFLFRVENVEHRAEITWGEVRRISPVLIILDHWSIPAVLSALEK